MLLAVCNFFRCIKVGCHGILLPGRPNMTTRQTLENYLETRLCNMPMLLHSDNSFRMMGRKWIYMWTSGPLISGCVREQVYTSGLTMYLIFNMSGINYVSCVTGLDSEKQLKKRNERRVICLKWTVVHWQHTTDTSVGRRDDTQRILPLQAW